jgi:hypothetical protein
VGHYLTQGGSKAKPNGAMLKAGSNVDLSDETILKPGKSDQNSASREKSREIQGDREIRREKVEIP